MRYSIFLNTSVKFYSLARYRQGWRNEWYGTDHCLLGKSAVWVTVKNGRYRLGHCGKLEDTAWIIAKCCLVENDSFLEAWDLDQVNISI